MSKGKDLMMALDIAAGNIARVIRDPSGWAVWLIYLLEALEALEKGYPQQNERFEQMLEELRDAITRRLEGGSW